MKHSTTDLLDALRTGRFLAAHKAIQDGADPDFVSAAGEWPLDMAVSRRAYDLIDALIAAGANVNRIHRSETLLWKAIQTGDICLVARLLQHGANPHVHASHREAPFLSAVRRHDIEIMKLLIDAGVDVNAVDQYGETALSWCFHDPDAVAALELLGAEPRDVEHHLIAPLRFPTEARRPRVQEFIGHITSLHTTQCLYDYLIGGSVTFIVSPEQAGTDDRKHVSEFRLHLESKAQQFVRDVQHEATKAGCLVFVDPANWSSRGIFVHMIPTTDPFAAMAAVRIHDRPDGPGTYGLIRGFKIWGAEFPFLLLGCHQKSVDLTSLDNQSFPGNALRRLQETFRQICKSSDDAQIVTWKQSGSFVRVAWDWENG